MRLLIQPIKQNIEIEVTPNTTARDVLQQVVAAIPTSVQLPFAKELLGIYVKSVTDITTTTYIQNDKFITTMLSANGTNNTLICKKRPREVLIQCTKKFFIDETANLDTVFSAICSEFGISEACVDSYSLFFNPQQANNSNNNVTRNNNIPKIFANNNKTNKNTTNKKVGVISTENRSLSKSTSKLPIIRKPKSGEIQRSQSATVNKQLVASCPIPELKFPPKPVISSNTNTNTNNTNNNKKKKPPVAALPPIELDSTVLASQVKLAKLPSPIKPNGIPKLTQNRQLSQLNDKQKNLKSLIDGNYEPPQMRRQTIDSTSNVPSSFIKRIIKEPLNLEQSLKTQNIGRPCILHLHKVNAAGKIVPFPPVTLKSSEALSTFTLSKMKFLENKKKLQASANNLTPITADLPRHRVARRRSSSVVQSTMPKAISTTVLPNPFSTQPNSSNITTAVSPTPSRKNRDSAALKNSRFKKWAKVLKNESTKVYGVKLDEVMSRTSEIENKIPSVLTILGSKLTSDALKLEGVFRQSGNQDRINEFKNAADKGEVFEEHIDKLSVHDCACALKQYFQSLPEPLLTNALYDKFIISAPKIDEADHPTSSKEKLSSLKKSYIHSLLVSLSPARLNLLEFLLKLLKTVVQHSEENKMTINNVSIILGPMLLRKEDNSDAILHSSAIQNTAEYLLTSYDGIDKSASPLLSLPALSPYKVLDPSSEIEVEAGSTINLFLETNTCWYGEVDGKIGTFTKIFIDAVKALSSIEKKKGKKK